MRVSGVITMPFPVFLAESLRGAPCRRSKLLENDILAASSRHAKDDAGGRSVVGGTYNPIPRYPNRSRRLWLRAWTTAGRRKSMEILRNYHRFRVEVSRIQPRSGRNCRAAKRSDGRDTGSPDLDLEIGDAVRRDPDQSDPGLGDRIRCRITLRLASLPGVSCPVGICI